MKTRAELRAGVYDRLDSDGEDADDFYPSSRINDAIDAAVDEAVDRLAMTVARRRWMKLVPDLSADVDYDADERKWTLPDDWRRPFLVQRGTVEIEEVPDERQFTSFGQDGYMIVGQELWLTADTVAEDLEVWYIRRAIPMEDDDDTPDFVEGYDEYLIARAAAIAVSKADAGDPQPHIDEAARLWKSLIFASRNSAFPAKKRRGSAPYGEDWYG